jgi:hypothetical protein
MTLDELIEREGTTCVWCGRELWRRDLTAEHVLPRRRKGKGVPENLAIACRRCNRRRRTRSVASFVRHQLDAGEQPQLEQLRVVLQRLSASPSRTHADYGRRQLELLDSVTVSRGSR